jgi:hypothetical protein
MERMIWRDAKRASPVIHDGGQQSRWSREVFFKKNGSFGKLLLDFCPVILKD